MRFFGFLSMVFAFALFNYPAHAEGWYVGVMGGYSLMGDSEIDVAGGTETDSFEPGPTVSALIGWQAKDFRTDLELGYSSHDYDEFSTSTGLSDPSEGETKILSLMINIYADFPIGDSFAPYIGVGLGAANVDRSGFVSRDANTNAITAIAIDDDETTLAAQLAAGIGYKITPAVTLGADYRFFVATADFSDGTQQKVRRHTFGISARYAF